MPRCTTLPGAGLVRNLQATAGVVMGAGRQAPGSGVGTGASSEEEEGGVLQGGEGSVARTRRPVWAPTAGLYS